MTLKKMARPAQYSDAKNPRWAKPRGRRFSIRFSGMLYIVVTMLLVVAGVNSQNNLLFIAFGLGIAGLLVSGFISGAGMMSLRVRRSGVISSDGFGVVGTDSQIRYTVRNTSRWLPMFAVHLVEPIGEDGGDIKGFVPYVPARASVVVHGIADGKRRGIFELNRIELWSVFPLGIARKRVWHEDEGELVVRPAPYLLTRAPVPKARGTQRNRTAKRALRAASGEFFALREYADGDPIQAISWKRTATLDRPVVRQLAGAPSQRVVVRVTTSGTDQEEDDRTIAAAIAVVDRLDRHGSQVGLAVGHTVVLPGSGARHTRRLIRELCAVDARDSATPPSDVPQQDAVFEVASSKARNARAANLVPSPATDSIADHRSRGPA